MFFVKQRQLLTVSECRLSSSDNRPAVLSADGVSSANVVGYQQLTVTPGFNLISLNFEPLSGDSVDIQDLFADKTELVAGATVATADQIQIWDGSKFTTYYYRAYKAGNPGKFTIGPCWVNISAASAKAEFPIPRGVGVWFARPSTAPASAKITLSGAVSGGTKNLQINPGFNMIGSAFPVDITVNSDTCPIKWSECAIAGATVATADQIQIWDGSKFTTYYYRAYKAGNPGKFTIGPCWVNISAASAKADLTIPAGAGFWYARPDTSEAGNLPQTSPIAE